MMLNAQTFGATYAKALQSEEEQNKNLIDRSRFLSKLKYKSRNLSCFLTTMHVELVLVLTFLSSKSGLYPKI